MTSPTDAIHALTDGQVAREFDKYWGAIAEACEKHLGDLQASYKPLVPGRAPEAIQQRKVKTCVG
jgi:hypothetical protein